MNPNKIGLPCFRVRFSSLECKIDIGTLGSSCMGYSKSWMHSKDIWFIPSFTILESYFQRCFLSGLVHISENYLAFFQVLAPDMSLATVRAYIWKKADDLVLNYRLVQGRWCVWHPGGVYWVLLLVVSLSLSLSHNHLYCNIVLVLVHIWLGEQRLSLQIFRG